MEILKVNTINQAKENNKLPKIKYIITILMQILI